MGPPFLRLLRAVRVKKVVPKVSLWLIFIFSLSFIVFWRNVRFSATKDAILASSVVDNAKSNGFPLEVRDKRNKIVFFPENLSSEGSLCFL